MAILHGSWVREKEESFLFIWGQVWRRVEPFGDLGWQSIAYPFAMTTAELLAFFQQLEKSGQLPLLGSFKEDIKKKEKGGLGINKEQLLTREIVLPTQFLKTGELVVEQSGMDIAEESEVERLLYPWQVEGIKLTGLEVGQFLQALPLGNSSEGRFFGGDLRFWSYVGRWGLDLQARGKFLPTLKLEEKGYRAGWEVLLDSGIDGERLESFAQEMPLSCRSYQKSREGDILVIDLFSQSQELLIDFLRVNLDAQIRSITGGVRGAVVPPLWGAWLQGLGANSGAIKADLRGMEGLENTLKNWVAPLGNQEFQQRKFQPCFRLLPPASSQVNWQLRYGLQAVNQPDFIVDAQVIWSQPVERFVYQGKVLEQPQELLLQGLGLASRLNPAIEPSLNESAPVACVLNPLQAYEFLKSGAWRFQDNGLGVILPGSWQDFPGSSHGLGLRITADNTKLRKTEKIGLQSLLNFKWELALGEQIISKEEFEKLVKLNSPLVEVNGQWVELKASEVKAAQAFFAKRKEETTLSLQDALQLATGDTQTIEKLPVVNFTAGGGLQDLLENLTTNRAIEAIKIPQTFEGSLREYQARGAGWLAFLEKWGLGACLADDMGLGKCVARDTNIFVNGQQEKAEEIWSNYAGKIEFDGEGFWAIPTQELIVNSIDENTGKIVPALVQRLYRQKVEEKLRKVTLNDGTSITITRRHKLLTKDGWSNQLKLGDCISRPAKLLGSRKAEDHNRFNNQDLKIKSNLQTLTLTRKRLLDVEVSYCPIKSIEEIDYDGWVYDLEVNKHHNFVANNILCHNTIQSIAFFLYLQENNRLERPVLLVCPTSVLGNWEREVRKFAPTLKVMQYHGANRPKGSALLKAVNSQNLVITSYPLVQRDLKDLQAVKWQGIVLDEAQNIKNVDSKQSQAVREITSDFRIALTGTPVENRLSELWAIMEFLNPGYLGAKNFFQRRFAIPIEKYGDKSSLQTLKSLVQPFILRRLKTDAQIIQDLPEKQEINVFCGLSETQAGLYQNLVEQSLAEIESAQGIQRRGMILGLLVKLKQVCNHPILYTKQGELLTKESGKLLCLDERLESILATGERALIFTQFAEWGKLLKPYLAEKFAREVFFLYGGTSKKQREEMVDRFQQDPQGPPLMILSLKAGGTGLNLTRATHVFHYDRWWNPAVENQATDRVFRIGQTRNVQVHKFVCTGTLEEKIHDMIESKKALAEQVIGEGENWLTELDTNQLRNLLLLDKNSIMDS